MSVDPTVGQLRQILTPPEIDEDAVVERLRSRLNEYVEQPNPHRARRMPAARRWAVVISVALAIVAVAGVAVAADYVPAFWHSAAEDVSTLSADTTAASGLNEDERDVLSRGGDLLASAPDPQVDSGPVLGDLLPTERARVLIDVADGRIAAVPTKRGDVCMTYSVNGSIASASCFGELRAAGAVAISEVRNLNGNALYGLAKSSVEAIHVIDSGGDRSEAALSDNAWVWRVEDPKITPQSVEIHFSDGREVTRPVAAADTP